jgi:hypothetical protein
VTSVAVDQRTPLSPESAPSRLVEMSADVRAAVVANPAGGLIAAAEDLDPERARLLATLLAELFGAADSAAGAPAQQVEAQVEGGAVFAVRSAHHLLGCVVKRLALPALVLYDLQRTLDEMEAGA